MKLKLSELQTRILKWLIENQVDVQKDGVLIYKKGKLEITDTYKKMKFDVAKEVGKVFEGRKKKEKIKRSFHPTFSNSFKALVKHGLVTKNWHLTQKGIEKSEELSISN